MAGNERDGKISSRRPKKGLPLIGSGVALLALVAVAIYAVAGQEPSGEVERFMHLHGLAAPAWAPEEVFVASHQGLARIDAQGEWSFVSEERHDFMGFQANHSEEGVFYSSGHPAPGSNLLNPVGFMVSRDAGATWEIISLAGQVDFHVMAVQSTSGDVVYGYSGGLMRSLDGGRQWERVIGEVTRIGDLYALAVHPNDPATLLAGSSSGLWRSEDAGKTWKSVIPRHPVTAVTYYEDSIWAYVVAAEAGLVTSDNDGEEWQSAGFLLEGDDAIAYIAPRPGKPEDLYLGSFGQDIYQTTDGAESWERLAAGGVPEDHGADHSHPE